MAEHGGLATGGGRLSGPVQGGEVRSGRMRPAGAFGRVAAAGSVVVVGLGPGRPGQVTVEARDALRGAARVYCRTAEHPTLAGLGLPEGVETFDHVYGRVARLEEVYPIIAEEVAAAAQEAAEGEEVAYAVPGDPCTAEASVRLLHGACRAAGVGLRVLPGVSFVEPVLGALGIDMLPRLAVVDAIDVAESGTSFPPDMPTLLTQVHSPAVASGVKLALAASHGDEHRVTFVHAAGTEAEKVQEMFVYEIDRRTDDIGLLTALYVPPAGGSLEALLMEAAAAGRAAVDPPAGPRAAAADLPGDFGLVPTQGAVELDLGAAPGSGAFAPAALEPLVADLVAAAEEDEPEQTLDAMADLLAGVAEQLTRAMDEGYLEEAPVAAVLERSLRRLRLRGAG